MMLYVIVTALFQMLNYNFQLSRVYVVLCLVVLSTAERLVAASPLFFSLAVPRALPLPQDLDFPSGGGGGRKSLRRFPKTKPRYALQGRKVVA